MLDASLPDGEVRTVAEAGAALQELADASDPEVRAIALAGRVATAPPEEVSLWLDRAGWDPDATVNLDVLDALARRGMPELDASTRRALALRSTTDPVVRGLLALERVDAGDDLAELATAWKSERDWARIPLLLVAVRLDAAGAREALLKVLSEQPLPDDPALVAALGACGVEGAAAAIAQASGSLEEAASTASEAARAWLGDPEGRLLWQASLRARDPARARDALDLMLALPDDRLAAVLPLTRGARDPVVRAAVAVLEDPSADALVRMVASKNPGVREMAGRLADRWGRGMADAVAPVLLNDAEPDLRKLGALLVAHHRIPVDAALVDALRIDDRARLRAAGHAAALVLQTAATTR